MPSVVSANQPGWLTPSMHERPCHHHHHHHPPKSSPKTTRCSHVFSIQCQLIFTGTKLQHQSCLGGTTQKRLQPTTCCLSFSKQTFSNAHRTQARGMCLLPCCSRCTCLLTPLSSSVRKNVFLSFCLPMDAHVPVFANKLSKCSKDRQAEACVCHVAAGFCKLQSSSVRKKKSFFLFVTHAWIPVLFHSGVPLATVATFER